MVDDGRGRGGPPIVLLDVGYTEAGALAASVEVDRWDAPTPAKTHTLWVPGVAAYRPGEFYERELPPILALLTAFHGSAPPAVVVVDGYVWLDEDGRKGLGAHLHDAVGVPVVGVAKTAFRGSGHAVPVRRGGSARPLYVTAAGIAPADAADAVCRMHGGYRIPNLLKLVDALSRGRDG